MSEKINFDTSLGDFVAEYPQSRDVFTKYDLDYCCGGKKNLVIAAKEKNIDLNEFESLLQKVIEVSPPTDKNKKWMDESLTDIVDHIENNHHAFTKEKLESTEFLLDKLIAVHAEKHGDFLPRLKNMFMDFKRKLEKHLKDEEEILFKFVRQFDESISLSKMPIENSSLGGGLDTFILDLEKDHEEAGEILAQIRDFTSNYELPEYGCASFLKLYADMEALEYDLHIHIHLENTVLLPKLKKAIS